MIYIGVDPGKITGIAVYWSVKNWYTAYTGDFDKTCDVVNSLLPRNEPDEGPHIILAVERYTPGITIRSSQTDALELIGVMKWLARIHGARFKLQGAAQASHVGNRENLSHAGWWIPGDPDQHRNKAFAQVALAVLTYEPKVWHRLITAEEDNLIS